MASRKDFDLRTTQRKSADLMAEGFGAGVNAPFLVIVDADDVNYVPGSTSVSPFTSHTQQTFPL